MRFRSIYTKKKGRKSNISANHIHLLSRTIVRTGTPCPPHRETKGVMGRGCVADGNEGKILFITKTSTQFLDGSFVHQRRVIHKHGTSENDF